MSMIYSRLQCVPSGGLLNCENNNGRNGMSPQLQAHDLLAMRLVGMSLGELGHHMARLREVHEMLCALSRALGISASSRMDALHLMRRIVEQLEQAQLLVEEIQAHDAHDSQAAREHDDAQSRLAPPNKF